MLMEVGLSLPIKMPIAKKAEFVKKAKSLGITSIWIGDNPPINNAFLDIGRLIGSVNNIKFWTGITSPFYYSLEVLFSLSVWLNRNYPGRFGLGLGTGNPEVIEDEDIIKKPYTSFTRELEKLLNLVEIRKVHQIENDFPPLAIGGLGDKMINYALKKTSILLLNSGSIFDLERALKKVDSSPKKDDFEIIPYSMLQTISKNDSISLTLWNIVKDIAKGASDKILKAHKYQEERIERIRKLTWNRITEPPNQDLHFIAEDFALFGSLESILEKLAKFKQLEEKGKVKKIVLGWIHEENKWGDLQEIINFLV